MSTNWYMEIGPEVSISQGDIFLNAPVASAFPELEYNDGEWKLVNATVNAEVMNFVVLNQACDLENKPPETVIVAEVIDAFVGEVEPGVRRKDLLSEIHAGRRPRYMLIGEHISEKEALCINYQVVDLASIYTLPYAVLDEMRKHTDGRLRLNTPHRELLNQHFGNYYSRIGLPNEDFISKRTLIEKLAQNQS